MSERSILRVRNQPHIDPRRRGETIVQVVRDGEVVATIYGTREGVQITSDRFDDGQPLPLFVDAQTISAIRMNSWTIPLLAPGEACPWCNGTEARCLFCKRGRDVGRVP